MSWEQVDISDLDLQFPHGLTEVSFTCPRCGRRQSTSIDLTSLLYGVEISCQNHAVCGEHQMYFELQLDIPVSGQKGVLDRPLESPNRAKG